MIKRFNTFKYISIFIIAIFALQMLRPISVQASVIKDVTDKISYNDVYKRYAKVVTEINNENKVVSGNYEKITKDIATARIRRLEYEKKILNELLIIKGEQYTATQKEKADKALEQMETGPIKKVLKFAYNLGLQGFELINYIIEHIDIRSNAQP